MTKCVPKLTMNFPPKNHWIFSSLITTNFRLKPVSSPWCRFNPSPWIDANEGDATTDILNYIEIDPSNNNEITSFNATNEDQSIYIVFLWRALIASIVLRNIWTLPWWLRGPALMGPRGKSTSHWRVLWLNRQKQLLLLSCHSHCIPHFLKANGLELVGQSN